MTMILQSECEFEYAMKGKEADPLVRGGLWIPSTLIHIRLFRKYREFSSPSVLELHGRLIPDENAKNLLGSSCPNDGCLTDFYDAVLRVQRDNVELLSRISGLEEENRRLRQQLQIEPTFIVEGKG